MYNELIIGKELNIRTYPQYAFLDAIMNNDKTNNSKICSMHINDNSKFNWDFQHINAVVDTEDGDIQIYRNEQGVHSTGGFYCSCSDFKEIVFNISYMQYTNVWNNISFFYSCDDTISFLDNAFYDYRFSIFCCGNWKVELNENDVYYKNNFYEKEIPKWYKVQKQDNAIKLFCSMNGKKWEELHSAALFNSKSENTKVGFCIQLYENQYHKWLCNNYIQIKFNNKDGKAIDYVGLMNRDYVNYAINPIVKFSYDKREGIKKRGLWNYIRDNICNNKYLELWLDEYYIEGTNAFKQYSYNHQSLIYGFDDEKERVFLMSFVSGKPTLISTSLCNLEMAWEKAYDNNYIIYLFEFLPDIKGYNIDIKHICNLLQDYIQGKNSSETYQYVAEADTGVFGHKIYNEILRDIHNQEMFLSDVRISFLIKEHKECMLFRIKYLYEYGAFSEESYTYILELMTGIVNKSEIIMNLVLKNMMKKNHMVQERVWEHMRDLCDLEKKCYQIVIQELNEYISSELLQGK